uniref:NADP-dependent oxidoreductase domain-containing protein n=1 Tax=Corethron hystrix TaxID=216773 RepID=A0A7S1BCF8_9STRA|mmetsp:Transcript_20093/g.45535  ORF Transcript_20093/g.45535 Transcript_20093/m.45535 type:complete len:404 (+) Transcript_20093:118-1329(+)
MLISAPFRIGAFASTLYMLSKIRKAQSLQNNFIAKNNDGVVTNKVGTVLAGKDPNKALTISEIGCGTWSWGNRLLFNYDKQQDEDIYDAFKIVRDAGVNIFDTADSYGTLDLNGRAESLLGQFERRYLTEKGLGKQNKSSNANLFDGIFSPPKPNPRDLKVASKFAIYPWRLTRGSIVSAAKASVARLGRPKVELAQLHWSADNYAPWQETALWDGIADVYDAGLCDAVGVSNYGPKQLRKFSRYMEKRGVPLATCQVQYSLMTAGADVTRGAKDACDEVGCRLIAYSPLCLGLLTGKYSLDALPPNGNPRRQLFKELLPGAEPLLKTLEAVALDYGRSQSQVAINWSICKGGVPIPGARNKEMAMDNIEAAGWRLKSDAIDELDLAASRVSKPMIQNIFQTN